MSFGSCYWLDNYFVIFINLNIININCFCFFFNCFVYNLVIDLFINFIFFNINKFINVILKKRFKIIEVILKRYMNKKNDKRLIENKSFLINEMNEIINFILFLLIKVFKKYISEKFYKIVLEVKNKIKEKNNKNFFEYV